MLSSDTFLSELLLSCQYIFPVMYTVFHILFSVGESHFQNQIPQFFLFSSRLSHQSIKLFMLHNPSIAPFQPFPWLMENIVREMIVYIFIKHKRISIVVNLIEPSKCL